MIVTGEGFAADADEGAAGSGSGTADFVVDSVVMRFAAIGEAGFVGSAVRFVAFRTDVFFGASVSARVLTTGRAPIAAARGAGPAEVGAESATTTALSCCFDGCCERGMSLGGGHRGTATVAITSTATPASTPICIPVGCHGGVGGLTCAATGIDVDSTAACVATTGAGSGAAIVVVEGVTGSA